MFLAVGVRYTLCLKQADVETAFLNGPLEETVHIACPGGYVLDGVEVLELLKALYGLPEAPKYWYEHLREILLKLGFHLCTVESCLFIFKQGKKFVIILIYVDDMLIVGNEENVYTRDNRRIE